MDRDISKRLMTTNDFLGNIDQDIISHQPYNTLLTQIALTTTILLNPLGKDK